MARGQATLEVVLVLPLVMLLVMLSAQVCVIVRNEVLVNHAVREAVRAASVSEENPEEAARRAAEGAGPLASHRMTVTVDSLSAEVVRISVAYEDPTDMPLIGRLIPSVRHSVTAAMRRESMISRESP